MTSLEVSQAVTRPIPDSLDGSMQLHTKERLWAVGVTQHGFQRRTTESELIKMVSTPAQSKFQIVEHVRSSVPTCRDCNAPCGTQTD
jgi:hypothetical protein